jgi:hypothetical protein
MLLRTLCFIADCFYDFLLDKIQIAEERFKDSFFPYS